ncbi:hypothetical protein Pan44_02110 [Caulifigura coniformis]|uniref:Sulfatase n=1 Tax=Caulifigura coniformis TaxID=2527983 RepID=A0A517S7V5_9PLAN|nr:DUF1501 domain-containing protein [Caulifigura coniformis]QDT52202.1 hypothetical protein Pan44_02110 [Caulifigura coniformis]
MPMHRRTLLQAGAVSWLGLSWPQLLAAQQAVSLPASDSFGKAKACILLFMWGGPAHQDTWDLKPEAPREIRGEFQPISTATPGIQICEHFPELAQRTDRLAIVRSMTHNNVDHTTSTHFLLTGQPPPPDNDLKHDWPSLGSVVSRLGRGRQPLPPFVSMRPKVPGDVPRFVEQSHGQFAGWLGKQFDPLTIDADPNTVDYRVADFALQEGIAVSRLDERRALLAELERQRRALDVSAGTAINEHYRRAFHLLQDTAGGDAFDLAQEPAEMRDRYGRNPHGQSVLQARRLVERGVPLVCVFWPNDGIKNVSVYWDTHSRNFIDLKDRLMPVADRAFSTLLDDLSERGLLDETLVVWTGEFGRTPKVGQRNSDAGAGRDGRDHWPNCFTSVLAGGGVRGGQVYGASDRHAAYPIADAVQPVDLMATVHHLLGIPRELALADAQGRPQVVCPGEPVTRLFS